MLYNRMLMSSGPKWSVAEDTFVDFSVLAANTATGISFPTGTRSVVALVVTANNGFGTIEPTALSVNGVALTGLGGTEWTGTEYTAYVRAFQGNVTCDGTVPVIPTTVKSGGGAANVVSTSLYAFPSELVGTPDILTTTSVLNTTIPIYPNGLVAAIWQYGYISTTYGEPIQSRITAGDPGYLTPAATFQRAYGWTIPSVTTTTLAPAHWDVGGGDYAHCMMMASYGPADFA